MPRTKSTRPRPPRYILEPGALIYESAREAAGLAPISPEARDTYRVILGFSWVNKYQFTPPITRRQIADERRIQDESTISRHIAELVANGYLRIQASDGQANTYIPLVTYQSETATAHSPALLEADTAIATAAQPSAQQPQPQSTAHSIIANEPLARMQGVSGTLNSINSSCSDTVPGFKPGSQQQLLFNTLLDFQVWPDSARDMVTREPMGSVLNWLHTLVESSEVSDESLPRLLVANVLRDHRPAPRGPRPGSSWERERAEREIEWGLRPRPEPIRAEPQPARPAGPEPPISAEMQAATGAWQRALGELRLQLTSATFDTWLGRARLIRRENGTFIIGVHNGHAKDWLESQLSTKIERTLSGIVGQSVGVRFVVEAGEMSDGKA